MYIDLVSKEVWLLGLWSALEGMFIGQVFKGSLWLLVESGLLREVWVSSGAWRLGKGGMVIRKDLQGWARCNAPPVDSSLDLPHY